MSYDIDLVNKKTRETVSLNRPQFIRGGTVPAVLDEVTGRLVQTTQRDASINITYNYSPYFYGATEGDKRFEHTDSKGEVGYGIRGLYGKSAIESIPMLKDMIARIIEKYQDEHGDWLVTERKKSHYFDKNGNEITDPIRGILHGEEYEVKEEVYEVSEGDTSDYWEATAGNAIESLWNMIFIATDQMMNKDAVWDGD